MIDFPIMADLNIVNVDTQPWYEAEDGAVAREVVSPRNSRAVQSSIADIKVPAGVTICTHYHRVIEEVYLVTAGAGIMMINGVEKRIRAGEAVVILPGERHGIRNDTAEELRLLVTCTPPWTPDCLEFD